MPIRLSDEGYIALAKELAGTGRFKSIAEVEQKLWEEGCAGPATLLEAGWIREDLYAIIASASANS